jgi:hypothetical protein
VISGVRKTITEVRNGTLQSCLGKSYFIGFPQLFYRRGIKNFFSPQSQTFVVRYLSEVICSQIYSTTKEFVKCYKQYKGCQSMINDTPLEFTSFSSRIGAHIHVYCNPEKKFAGVLILRSLRLPLVRKIKIKILYFAGKNSVSG